MSAHFQPLLAAGGNADRTEVWPFLPRGCVTETSPAGTCLAMEHHPWSIQQLGAEEFDEVARAGLEDSI